MLLGKIPGFALDRTRVALLGVLTVTTEPITPLENGGG